MIVHETLATAIGQNARLVVTPVADKATLDVAASADLTMSSDVVELRIDGLTDCLDLAEQFARSCQRPILLTVRDQREGGAKPLSLVQRTELYNRYLEVASAIDIEVQCLRDLAGVVEAAKKEGKLVVASAHDFARMPVRSQIDALAQHSSEDADIFKIAATPADLSEVFSLAKFVSEADFGLPVSAMGMGKFGKISRLVCAQAGSVLNYGYLSHPNAPGQWPSAQLRSLIADLEE